MNEDEILEGLSDQEREMVISATALFKRAGARLPSVSFDDLHGMGAIGRYIPGDNEIVLDPRRHSYNTTSGYYRNDIFEPNAEDSSGTLAHEYAHALQFELGIGKSETSGLAYLLDISKHTLGPNETEWWFGGDKDIPKEGYETEYNAEALGIAIEQLLEGTAGTPTGDTRIKRTNMVKNPGTFVDPWKRWSQVPHDTLSAQGMIASYLQQLQKINQRSVAEYSVPMK
jgi:hypothetical protein